MALQDIEVRRDYIARVSTQRLILDEGFIATVTLSIEGGLSAFGSAVGLDEDKAIASAIAHARSKLRTGR